MLYEIKIDNTGDAIEDITYQFRFRTEYLKRDSGLLASDPVTASDAAALQVRQRYSVTRSSATAAPRCCCVISSPHRSTPAAIRWARRRRMRRWPRPRSIHWAAMSVPTARVFVGQRDDPFYADLGSLFDLLRVRCRHTNAAAGCGGGGAVRGVDYVAGYNVHTIALQIPVIQLCVPTPRARGAMSSRDLDNRQSPRVTIRRVPPLIAAEQVSPKTRPARGCRSRAWVCRSSMSC